MEHRIITDLAKENTIEWCLADRNGYPCVLARKGGQSEWTQVSYARRGSPEYVVDCVALARIGLSLEITNKLTIA